MNRPQTKTVTVFVLVAAIAVSACSSGKSRGKVATTTSARSSTTTAERGAAPGATWEKVTPAAVGLDAGKLDAIAATAKTGKSNCLVVVRDAKVAGEWYFRDTGANSAQDIFSATKSITSTLVGIAQDDGDLRIDDSASKWITEWKGTPSEKVTVRDLLSNDSGRQWSPTIDYRELLLARDRTAFAIGLDQAAAPGTVWAYNNSAIQTLQRVLENATGEDVATFARHRLFEPLGMTNTTMATDRAGNAQMFEGAHSTCLDLARFGQLMLNEGRWGDEQIVSTGWVHAATGASSTKLNAAYGYLWWLNREGVIGNPLVATDLQAAANPKTLRGRLVPGAPDDLYWALGLGNQLVQVDPSSKTVVVRLGTAEARPQPPTFGPVAASKVVTEAIAGPGVP